MLWVEKEYSGSLLLSSYASRMLRLWEFTFSSQIFFMRCWAMEDIGLFNQGLKWLQSKDYYSVAWTVLSCLRDKIGIFMERHWPMVCCGCAKFGRGLLFLLVYWKNCSISGFQSFVGLGSAALLVIMWSCFLSLTSMSCLLYVLISMGAAGAAVQYLGYTPGLFIVGLVAILVLWMYANFWITGTLFIVGGYLFSLNHARLLVFMATLYAIYCVKVRVGWVGVFLAVNLAFLSNDVLDYLIKRCDNLSESSHFEEQKESVSFTEDDFSTECKYSAPTEVEGEEEKEKIHSYKSASKPASPSSFVEKAKEAVAKKVVKEDADSITEMKRILNSGNHYEALGFPQQKKIDVLLLKKEYRRKNTTDFCSEESRRIQCTKCGNSHVWVCTNRTKAKARWCQDCCQYHQAKDGDGWVEYKGSLVFDQPQKVEIPRAFVCAESKIFDVSEWAICQGMACRPNTHRPSFHVNMVGLEKSSQRSNSSRYPWDLDAEMMDEEDEFEMWLQQALASGLFSESSKRRKSWSPFKLPQKKGKKQWRRAS
ncbi:chaperone DnaJ-domain superfamily protein [Striga asiatica]|uniref:Chaperone DnaJ-domain superfamily protein n=1 Tax=Striga asiatica TaxID=4170 RepID=A0A5A7R7S4_STRAF|nr:chaperone DnaJ-domain superfamily protein [Striga asiatica]